MESLGLIQELPQGSLLNLLFDWYYAPYQFHKPLVFDLVMPLQHGRQQLIPKVNQHLNFGILYNSPILKPFLYEGDAVECVSYLPTHLVARQHEVLQDFASP